MMACKCFANWMGSASHMPSKYVGHVIAEVTYWETCLGLLGHPLSFHLMREREEQCIQIVKQDSQETSIEL